MLRELERLAEEEARAAADKRARAQVGVAGASSHCYSFSACASWGL